MYRNCNTGFENNFNFKHDLIIYVMVQSTPVIVNQFDELLKARFNRSRLHISFEMAEKKSISFERNTYNPSH